MDLQGAESSPSIYIGGCEIYVKQLATHRNPHHLVDLKADTPNAEVLLLLSILTFKSSEFCPRDKLLVIHN